MVSEGNKTMADRWHLFEEACENAGPGDLFQLLRSFKGMSTPTSQPSTPSPMDTSKAPTPLPSPVKIKQ